MENAISTTARSRTPVRVSGHAAVMARRFLISIAGAFPPAALLPPTPRPPVHGREGCVLALQPHDEADARTGGRGVLWNAQPGDVPRPDLPVGGVGALGVRGPLGADVLLGRRVERGE